MHARRLLALNEPAAAAVDVPRPGPTWSALGRHAQLAIVLQLSHAGCAHSPKYRPTASRYRNLCVQPSVCGDALQLGKADGANHDLLRELDAEERVRDVHERHILRKLAVLRAPWRPRAAASARRRSSTQASLGGSTAYIYTLANSSRRGRASGLFSVAADPPQRRVVQSVAGIKKPSH